MTLKEFIQEHENDDTARLMLSGNRWPDIDIDKAVTIIECRKKIRTKLPEWYEIPEIIYPDRLSSEQSSSSATAKYKASIADRIVNGGRIADLTGGLGADSLAFSRVASQVMYNEMEPVRAEAARHNFPLLGAGNISVSRFCVEEAGKSEGAANFWETLKRFSPDLVYMDPARRSATGSKVFLLEDCSPDVLTLIPNIFGICNNLLLKLSPMADISMLLKRLQEHGAGTKELHIVSAGGECKELLLWCTPSATDDTALIINENGNILRTSIAAESAAVPQFLQDAAQLNSMQFLFEPGKALAKAGLFNAICTMQDNAGNGTMLLKAGRSTHLYFTDSQNNASNFGKTFKIIGLAPFCKQGIRDFSAKYPRAEVSARNLPLTSEELRRKLKVQSGGDIHIFGLHIDFCHGASANYLVAATRQK